MSKTTSRRLNDSHANRSPFCDFNANSTWLAVICMTDTLMRWFQAVPHRNARRRRSQTLRWALWHTRGRIVQRSPPPHYACLALDGWPTTATVLGADQRVDFLT